MDTAILVDDLDKSAINLVKALNSEKFNFTTAALMKDPDTEDWQIVLGIPKLRTEGSRNSFVTIYDVIKESGINLTLNDVKLLDERDPTLLLLKRRFDPTPEISRIIFTGNYIEGVRIPDSIIYYIK